MEDIYKSVYDNYADTQKIIDEYNKIVGDTDKIFDIRNLP